MEALYFFFHEIRVTLIPKPDKTLTKKIKSNIPYDYRCKNASQNISTLNPTVHGAKVWLQKCNSNLTFLSVKFWLYFILI